MNPQQPSKTSDGDNTVLSAQNQPVFGAPNETTEATDPSDATVVRVPPSAPTVDEMASPDRIGRYELLGEIARGGMGVVYRARQRGLDRVVALKMILGTSTDSEATQRFLQEARAAAALDHPNVVPIYDIDSSNGRPYFTMALVEGPNLRAYTDAQGRLPVPTVVSLFAQVVAGVAHAHAAGIIHRDLKPANVLVDKDGRPRVTDFGLAKRAATDSHLTVTGQVVGTPSYMAPEQARDSKDVGPPADVYALGAILYFLLAGRPPFVGDSFTDLLIKVVSDAPTPLRELRPDVPADLEALCMRCLAKAPAERFADAQVLAAALVPVVEQHVHSASGLSPALARVGLSRASTPSTGTLPEFRPPAGSAPEMSNSITAPLPQAPAPSAPLLTPRAPANRKPLLIGLGAGAVLLVAVIGFLATRGDRKKDDTAKLEPPASGTPGAPPGPPPVVAPEALPPAPAGAGFSAWPVPERSDFGLKVELSAPAAKQDKDGVIRISAGSPMTVHVKADRDSRVSIWIVEANGHAMRVFPNDDEPDDRVRAGQERVVPGNDKYELVTTATEGAGVDRLRVFATTGEPPAFPPGAKTGRFTTYTGPDAEQLASTVRGVTIKKTGGGTPAPLAQAELRFHVK